MADEAIRTERHEAVLLVHLDDGKANALSPTLIEGLHAVLDRAEKEAGAVLLAGRPGRFSAGFDLATMGAGADAARALVTAGAELLLRLLEFPRPLVAACTGHALAAGALLLLASDTRLGARGAFKIGLNEVAIGMRLPIFAVEMARARLAPPHFTRAVLQAEIYAPEGALEAGFLDRLTEPERLLEAAREEAMRLAGLPAAAFAGTKRLARGDLVARVRETLAEDMARISGPTPR